MLFIAACAFISPYASFDIPYYATISSIPILPADSSSVPFSTPIIIHRPAPRQQQAKDAAKIALILRQRRKRAGCAQRLKRTQKWRDARMRGDGDKPPADAANAVIKAAKITCAAERVRSESIKPSTRREAWWQRAAAQAAGMRAACECATGINRPHG